MPANKLVKKLRKEVVLTEKQFEAYYEYGTGLSPEGAICCGLTELEGVGRLNKITSREFYKRLLYLYEAGDLSSLIFCTSTVGRLRNLERLGFKLAQPPFVNSNSGNTIWMYTILRDDLFPAR